MQRKKLTFILWCVMSALCFWGCVQETQKENVMWESSESQEEMVSDTQMTVEADDVTDETEETESEEESQADAESVSQCLKESVEKYLNMTVKEISEKTGVYLEENGGSLRILSNAAFFPVLCLEDKGIVVVCLSYDVAETPRYVTVYDDLQDVFLSEYKITEDMNFADIREAMLAAGCLFEEHIEWGGDYADVYRDGSLSYSFVSHLEDGTYFSVYVSKGDDIGQNEGIKVEPATPMMGNWYVDEEGIERCDIYVEVGNISKEERDYFTAFFQKNAGGGFLLCDYDRPQDVDLELVFYGARTTAWEEEELEASEGDYEYKEKTEINETLMKFIGLTNEQMSEPLFVKNVNDKEVVAWLPFQRKPETPICLGGYKDGDTYILLMQTPFSVVTLKKNDNDTVSISSNRTLRIVTLTYKGIGYNPNEKYNADSLSDYTASELELLRNEYYARHGAIFDDPITKLYFEAMSWYRPSVEKSAFDESVFNEVEKANLAFIDERLKALR